MDINRDYKQISVHSFSCDRTDYNALKGKVVEKVGFTDRDSYDTQMLIITFTDKTFICVGVRYNLSDFHMDEPQLENYDVLPPQYVKLTTLMWTLMETSNLKLGLISLGKWVYGSSLMRMHYPV